MEGINSFTDDVFIEGRSQDIQRREKIFMTYMLDTNNRQRNLYLFHYISGTGIWSTV